MKGLIVSAAAMFVAAPAFGAAFQEAVWTPTSMAGYPNTPNTADADGDTFNAAMSGIGGAAGPGALLDLGGEGLDGSYTFGVDEAMGNGFNGDATDNILSTSESNVGNTYTISFDVTNISDDSFSPIGAGVHTLQWQGGVDNFGSLLENNGIGDWTDGFVIEGGTWGVYDQLDAELFSTTFTVGTSLVDIGDGGFGFQAGVLIDGTTPIDGLIWGFKAEIIITKIPAPGALAVFGLFGLAGTRRRR